MKKRMSMSEVLSKIALTKKRLADSVVTGDIDYTTPSFVSIKKIKSNDVKGIPVDTFTENALSGYQGIMDRIKNLEFLNSVKNGVNSQIEISIGGRSMTINEALGLKSDVIKQYYKNLIKKMRSDYMAAFSAKEKYDAEKFSDVNINNYLSVVLMVTGEDLKKADPVLVEKYTNQYKEQHGVELVDPLSISNKIGELETWVSDFYDNIDFKLSMINSRIIVEFDLDNKDAGWEIVNMKEIEDLEKYIGE